MWIVLPQLDIQNNSPVRFEWPALQSLFHGGFRSYTSIKDLEADNKPAESKQDNKFIIHNSQGIFEYIWHCFEYLLKLFCCPSFMLCREYNEHFNKVPGDEVNGTKALFKHCTRLYDFMSDNQSNLMKSKNYQFREALNIEIFRDILSRSQEEHRVKDPIQSFLKNYLFAKTKDDGAKLNYKPKFASADQSTRTIRNKLLYRPTQVSNNRQESIVLEQSPEENQNIEHKNGPLVESISQDAISNNQESIVSEPVENMKIDSIRSSAIEGNSENSEIHSCIKAGLNDGKSLIKLKEGVPSPFLDPLKTFIQVCCNLPQFTGGNFPREVDKQI